ncbi:hypothetical protein GALL_46910 [mine drainage metagenome]|uniref:Outer membrane protein beta-barrel domain-containing protein n=1 Tax=mine drainage metagenome TaxID=410659 RepID=A0A1J5TD41_9ZZZZ
MKFMKKNFFFLILLFLSFNYSFAQTSSIRGTITDTLNKQSLKNASVLLLYKTDSVLYRHTKTDKNGKFELNNLKAGKYVLMLTYPAYADFMDEIIVPDTGHLQLDHLALLTKARLLEEVVVHQRIPPIRLKGDTLEFIADSFKVKQGATVEDLLKKFPGFTVNSKGEITAQGQKIEKVLVDGDEFFGDDPTMATQNLNAKDVAKVQMFDKKSDQSVITGIDDGQKQKTLNLILKEDAKKGYFGNAQAGTDFDKYYQAKLTANRFTSKMKAGIYTTVDRTGKNNMTWNEMQDFSDNLTISAEDGGSIGYQSDGFDTYNLQGIPENLTTAAMFNNKFGKYKSNTVNNYSFKDQHIAGDATTNSTYILPDTVYYNNQTNHFNNSKWQHSFGTRNELNLDSLNTININAKGTWGHTSQNSVFGSEYLTKDKQRVNGSNRINTSTGNNDGQKADLFYKRKFNKEGTHTFTVNATFSDHNNNSDGYLYNQTSFYKNGIIDSAQVIDQRKTNTSFSRSVQGLLSYTNPLTKKISLNINYTFNTNNSEQDIRSFEKVNGKYDSLNLLYSNHFKFINTANKGGFSLNYNTKKLTGRIGLALQNLVLKETNLYNDSSLQRSFVNFFPTAFLRWKFSSEGSVYFNYSGYSSQPSLNQIQPIINNNDPLNIVIGNPDLKPSFVHSIYFNAWNSKVLNNQYFGIYGNLSFTQNAFSNKDSVDNLGRKINQTVNVDGIYNYRLSFNFGKKIKFKKLDLGISPSINGSRNINFINGLQNITKTIAGGLWFRVGKSVENKFDINFRYNPNYNHSVSSINTSATTNYWTHTFNSDVSYKFKKGWNINSDVVANFRQKINPTDINTNSIVWNASLEKRLLKKKDLYAIFTVNDILNQNIGFNRNITSNFITENTYTTVQRYFLVSLRWRFAKNRKINEDDF